MLDAKIPNQRAKDRAPPRKFSSMIKQMVVELDRDMVLYPEGNIVEVCTLISLFPSDGYGLNLLKWVRGPTQPALDGFTVRRKGDGPTKIRIVLHLEQQPEQYKVHPDLGMLD